ncbi:alpha/beta-hydrolase [Thozetella sp. PMI_491]|nr:alpha/beta-hydrolase [Thozetella sp. PMI_491]
MAPWDQSFRSTGPGSYLFLGAVGLSLSISVGLVVKASRGRKVQKAPKRPWTTSPRDTLLPTLSPAQVAALPYPPDVLPGTRDVVTPYGTIKVFEWGPEDGEKVLLLHGISTPCLCQSDLADELVSQGFRVMLFDYFGRGYSDTPTDVPFDMRLYTSQILLVLASSPLAWTGNDGFHLIGYSLGGAIAASFAGYFPHLLRSLTLVAGGGLIRSSHVGWQSRLIYSEGVFPEWFLQMLVRARLAAPPPGIAPGGNGAVTETTTESEVVNLDPEALTAQKRKAQEARAHKNSDVNGGDDFDSAVLSRRRPGVTVSHVMAWQMRHHQGFIPAFMSSLRRAPIYDQQNEWIRLGQVLQQRREDTLPGLRRGKILLVLGETDPVIVKEELIHDATAVLTEDGFEAVMLEVGHEIAIAKGTEVAKIATEFWRRCAAGL